MPRLQQLLAELAKPSEQWPWEAVAVDGTNVADVPAGSEPVALLSMYITPSGGAELFFSRFDSNVAKQSLMEQILACVPSVGTLYRMEIQERDLAASGVFTYATDMQEARNEAVLAAAEEQFQGTNLPVALAIMQEHASEPPHFVFLGARNVPLSGLWLLYRESVIHGLTK